MLALAHGHALVRQVRNALKNGAMRGFCGSQRGGRGFNLRLQRAGLGHERGGVGPGALGLAHLFGDLLLRGAERFALSDSGAAGFVKLLEVAEDGCGVCTAGTEFFFHQRQVGADKGEVEHVFYSKRLPGAGRMRGSFSLRPAGAGLEW